MKEEQCRANVPALDSAASVIDSNYSEYCMLNLDFVDCDHKSNTHE